MDAEKPPHPKLLALMKSRAWPDIRNQLRLLIAERFEIDLVEEILQQTELRMLSGSASYDGEMDILVFGLRTARNVRSGIFRGNKRRAAHESVGYGKNDHRVEKAPHADGSPESQKVALEKKALWQEILAELRVAYAEGTKERAVLDGTEADLDLDQISETSGFEKKDLYRARENVVARAQNMLARRAAQWSTS